MKLYPNRWNLPLWELLGDPQPGTEKYLEAILSGGPLDSDRLIHVETGRSILIKECKEYGDDWRITAKGLARGFFRKGDRFLDSAYPARWESEGLFLPQGGMNQSWDSSQATLLGQLVRHGGIPVRVRPLSGQGGKKSFLLSCKGVLLLPGASYHIEHGTKKIALTLLAAGPFRDKDLSLLVSKAFRFPRLSSLRAIYSVNLRHRGWAILPPELWGETFDDALGEGNVRVMNRTFQFWRNKLIRRSKVPGGFTLDELQTEYRLPTAVGEIIARDLLTHGELVQTSGRFESTVTAQRRLSPVAKNVLSRLEQKTLSGLHRSAFRSELELRGLEDLVRMRLVLNLEDEWYLSKKSYTAIVDKLRSQPQHRWGLSELREVLEPSRSFLLTLLNDLVRQGIMVREGTEWSLRET